jgi:hypothetical protein
VAGLTESAVSMTPIQVNAHWHVTSSVDLVVIISDAWSSLTKGVTSQTFGCCVTQMTHKRRGACCNLH